MLNKEKGRYQMFNQSNSNKSQPSASFGARLGIFIYILMASSKILGGLFFDSPSVYADGLNNLSDVFSSLAIFIGLFIAQRPKDDDHYFDHHKYESLASFIVAMLMANIGIDVIRSAINRFIQKDFPNPDLKVMWISVLSSIILFITYKYLKAIATKNRSLGLRATAQDMFTDVMISLSTIIGTLAANRGYASIDIFIAILVGLLTIYSAFTIIKDSTFILSDAFNKEDLLKYQVAVEKHPRVKKVRAIRARRSGVNIYVDVVVEIDGALSVTESHTITEEIEIILNRLYQVYDTDVHVEPYTNKSNHY